MRVQSRITDQLEAIKHIISALNKQLDLYDNLRCKILDVADTGSANTEFSVTHGLGVKPVIYIANIDRSGIVYDSNRATWTDTVMTLKCSVANAVLKLVVF